MLIMLEISSNVPNSNDLEICSSGSQILGSQFLHVCLTYMMMFRWDHAASDDKEIKFKFHLSKLRDFQQTNMLKCSMVEDLFQMKLSMKKIIGIETFSGTNSSQSPRNNYITELLNYRLKHLQIWTFVHILVDILNAL